MSIRPGMLVMLSPADFADPLTVTLRGHSVRIKPTFVHNTTRSPSATAPPAAPSASTTATNRLVNH